MEAGTLGAHVIAGRGRVPGLSWLVLASLIMECYLIGASFTSMEIGAHDRETKPHVSTSASLRVQTHHSGALQ